MTRWIQRCHKIHVNYDIKISYFDIVLIIQEKLCDAIFNFWAHLAAFPLHYLHLYFVSFISET